MKKILLPTDFSENSINAIHYALELFQNEACEFHILNVQKVSSFISDDLMAMHSSNILYDALISNSKKRIELLINNIETNYSNALHEFSSNVDYDNFVDAINQNISANQIEIIVMGTRGDAKLDKRIFGSNTIRVIQRCNCPVVAIPNNYRYSQIKEVAFPSNYYTAFNPNDLSVLINLAEDNDYTVHAIHVKDSDHLTDFQENNRAFLDACFTNINHSFINLEKGDLFKSITSHVLYHNIGLLVMMIRKHSFWERLFTTHPVESFAFDLKVPFLVLKNSGEYYVK